MSHPLDDAFAKLDRADVHIRYLRRSIQTFINRPAYGIEHHGDPNTFEDVLIGRVLLPTPSVAWAARIGDVVNNLRSALDNLVWQLTLRHQGNTGQPSPPPDPIPFSGPDFRWRGIAFPIFTDQTKWPTAIRNKLWGVDPGLLTDFERLQPFYTGQQPGKIPDREPLAVLEELWNIDKHRHLHLVQSFVGLVDMRSTFRDLLPPEVEWPENLIHAPRVILTHAAGPFKDGAELGRYSQDGGNIIAGLGHMMMEARLSFDVAFDQGPPAYGGGVVDTLTELSKRCRSIVAQFEPELT